MSGIDKQLTELLKGKVIERVDVSAFPDIFIFFEDGTSLYYEYDKLIYNLTHGDEISLNISVSDKNKKELLKDKINRVYHIKSGWC